MEIVLAKLSDFGESRILAVKHEELRIVLFFSEEGTVYALEDRCSHADVKLSRGTYEDGEVTCPAHGARFEVCSGRALCMPALTPVRSFPVRIVDEEVRVTL